MTEPQDVELLEQLRVILREPTIAGDTAVADLQPDFFCLIEIDHWLRTKGHTSGLPLQAGLGDIRIRDLLAWSGGERVGE